MPTPPPKMCAYPGCANVVDPRWYVYDMLGGRWPSCDGHGGMSLPVAPVPMPTPPLPSRDDDEHGAMPADCRVETLAEWLVDIPLNDDSEFDFHAMARAVRALLEDRVRATIQRTRVVDCTGKCDMFIPHSVLGAP